MEIRILGPLDVRIGENQVRVRPGVHRLILTLLALRNRATIGADVLAELIWGNDAPSNPTNALHSQISHLRRAPQPLLEEGRQVVVTVPGGYLLDVPAEPSTWRGSNRWRRGRYQWSDPATIRLRGVRPAHRGPCTVAWRAAADAAGHPLVAADVTRLGELRLVALETRNEAMLATGRHTELMPELQQLVISHPLHERFHAQLMVALYRAGRQVDALRAAANARRLLVEEVGVEPGAELVALEQQILTHAEELSPDARLLDVQSSTADEVPATETGLEGCRRLAAPPRWSRLDSMLEQALDVALVVVAAPAGAGKTAALSGWLSRRPGGGSWVALEASDNDPAVFWSNVAAALELPRPDAHRDGRSVVRSIHERAVSRAVDVLVLDDYHVITNATIHAEIDALLAAVPSAVRLVIATRHDPPLRLAGLRAQAQLKEIRYDDLRLDTTEVDHLLNDVLGIAMQPDDVRTLVDRTEGWAVGVQLAAVSLQHQTDHRAFVDDFAGDRHIADYLRDEVLSRSRTTLNVLVRDRDPRPSPWLVVRSGHPETRSHEQLVELERLNLFVLPLHHRREWYRYHALFAEWLRLQPAEGVEERHRRAAEWLEARGFNGEALRHHLAGADPAAAAALIERERWDLVGRGRQRTLHDWIRLLPDATLRSRPRLIAAAAWVA